MLLKQNEWQLYTDGAVAEEATTPLFFARQTTVFEKESFWSSKGFVLHCKRTPFAT